MFRFEKLDVWNRAVAHACNVCRVTKEFPADERFGLTAQLRRAAVSIAANVTEGSGRASDVEFARYVEIAYGSLMEVVSHARIAKLQGLLTDEIYENIYRESDQLARMLSGLRASLPRKD